MAVEIRPIPREKLGNAYDAGMALRTQRDRPILDDDGLPKIDEQTGATVQERVRRPPSAKYVTMTGHVMHVRMSGGSGLAASRDPNRVDRAKTLMHRRGAVRYGVCPLRDQLSIAWMPKKVRQDKPCDPSEYGEDRPCKHITALIKSRSEKHEAREKQRAIAAKSDLQKATEEGRAQNAQLISALAAAIKDSRRPGDAG